MAPVKLALTLSCQHNPSDDIQVRLREHLEQTRIAADLGFDAVFGFEHFLTPQYLMLHQPTFLARVAAEAGPMRVGTGIALAALHNPVELADMIATLDVVTGGRTIFGVGLGYRQEEFDAFGVEKKRSARVFEAKLDVIRRLWAGEVVDAEGAGYRLVGAQTQLRPVQRPQPPLWIAANSDAAVRRAARLGDAWYIGPHSSVDVLERQLSVYREGLQEAGKGDPAELPLAREVFIDETRERAWERAKPYLEAKYRVYSEWGQDKVMPDSDAFGLDYRELARDRFLIGTPDDVLAGLQDCERRLGVNVVIVRLQWAGMEGAEAERALRLLGTEVLPGLQRVA
jgi:alkanesulfonate monooxygenase SsuD/methylene tetrahydromethanopterin reductase-like flavin-dependent oxidoreductase (luciferase family)